MADSSLPGRLRRGLLGLNQSWVYGRDGTEERWTEPGGGREVRVDVPPGTSVRVVEAHRGGDSLLLRTADGSTDAILHTLADLQFIPSEVASHEA